MSGKRRHDRTTRRPAHPGKTSLNSSRSDAGLSQSNGLLWVGWIAGLIVLAVAVGLVVKKEPPPSLPEISLIQLEPEMAGQIRRLQSAVLADPHSGAAWGKLGSLLKSLGIRDQAEICLRAAARFDAKEPRWPYLQALLNLHESGRFALEHLRRTVALCGNDPAMPRLRLARLLAETGRDDEARRQLEQLLQAQPDCGPARLMLAQIEHRRGEWEKARTWARLCTTNAHTARAAWTLLSTIYRRQGDPDAAELASRRAAAVTADAPWPDPFEEELLAWRNDARSLSDRAQSLLVAGRTADAWPLVQRLAKDHADFSETWLLLGRAQYLQRKPAEAEHSLRRFLEMEPDSVNGHFQLGMSQMARQRYEDAADTFRQATTLKRNFGPAYFNLGFSLAKSGRPREAIAAFEEAIRQNPEHIDSYILLADLHWQQREVSRARELAELAARLDPDDARLPVLHDKIRAAE